MESSETKINISRFQIKPKSAIALEMKKTYLEKKQVVVDNKISIASTDCRSIEKKMSAKKSFYKIL